MQRGFAGSAYLDAMQCNEQAGVLPQCNTEAGHNRETS